MANYSFFLSDGVTEITVVDSTITNTYTVPLLGQNVTAYGDDVAVGSMRHLENFASPDSPDTNINLSGNSVLKGQLWFDSASNVLKVNIGTTATPSWQAIAGVSQGTTTNAAARWSGSEWVEEERIQITDTGTLSIWDAGTNNVTLAHNGTDFIITNASGTGNVYWEDFTGDFRLRDGMELWVSGGVGNSQSVELVPDDGDFNSRIRTVGTDRIDIGGSISALNLEGALFLEQRASAFTDEATFGQVYVKTSDGGLYYKYNATGEVRLDISAGGTLTGSGTNNQIAVWSGPTSLDGSANFTFDGTTAEFSSSTFGQFVIDRQNFLGAGIKFQNSNGTKGYAGFNDFNQFEVFNPSAAGVGFQVGTDGGGGLAAGVIAAQGLTLGDNDQISFGAGLDMRMYSNGTDLVVVGLGTNDIEVSGADITTNQALEFRDVGSGSDTRIIFSGSGTTAYGGLSWQDNASNVEGSMFLASGIMVYTGQSHLYAPAPAGTVDYLCTIGTEFSFSGDDGGSDSLRLSTNDGSGTVSSKLRFVDAGGSTRNAGYNETPSLYMGTGTTTLSKTNVSRYLYRYTIGGTSNISLPNDSSIPTGSTWIISNWTKNTDPAGCTITPAGGVTLYWLDGSGASDATTGTRTLAKQGVCTIRKHSNTQYHIWGAGLS